MASEARWPMAAGQGPRGRGLGCQRVKKGCGSGESGASALLIGCRSPLFWDSETFGPGSDASLDTLPCCPAPALKSPSDWRMGGRFADAGRVERALFGGCGAARGSLPESSHLQVVSLWVPGRVYALGTPGRSEAKQQPRLLPTVVFTAGSSPQFVPPGLEESIRVLNVWGSLPRGK